ncbi:MAG: phospholipase [Deltaproteobacteria bacterium]|nr:phospholipase [Deltaproteobacteria bacterium]
MRQLPEAVRKQLVTALETGRLTPPFTELALRRYVGAEDSVELAGELSRLSVLGMTPALLREVLGLLEPVQGPQTGPTLVWTGPEDAGTQTRHTGVVVRELFATAEKSVLVAGFAVYQGQEVFEALASRMDERPELAVAMFLNIERRRGDTSAAEELVNEFASRLAREQWPGERLPEVFYDPRALEPDKRGRGRSSLHAKCVVVDEARVFVTSANFTRAAQERNIEVGLLVEDGAVARALVEQFRRLVGSRHLVALPIVGDRSEHNI